MKAATGLLTVNLDALVENWESLRRRAPQANVAAVIKADAYGLGAVPVARALARAGCRQFFFATVPEALAVRHLLPDSSECFILGGVAPDDMSAVFEHRLTPILSSQSEFERWSEWTEAYGHCGAGCGLKFDSGMTRMGLEPDELLAIARQPERCERLGVKLVMSHLACADEAAHPQNAAQLEMFSRVRTQVASYLPGVKFSLANSCGIYLGDDYHADLVRPGAALYGFNPAPGAANPMRPVVTLRLPVLQVRCLHHSASIGYGAEATRPTGAVLAVVAGGYADGLHRILGAQGAAECAGQEVPVVGRISMDTTLFDLTDLPDAQTLAGGSMDYPVLTVLGGAFDVNRVSTRNRALGYEVLTGLRSGRYRREYIGGEG
ncbi:alanine racemase [Gilvimarinus xylanilyticus]|uniref:Alanine racemase n=1 Tax=Gilvimarinus xylanilyticus TaxID=2944139 RepID=A0A9X2KV01_9GAMM|nr:alanine racemase [Gilvimarinus xylanilyticus]MCP8900884.1 alanine racemase [Gilvimarinus xylanilyticus]